MNGRGYPPIPPFHRGEISKGSVPLAVVIIILIAAVCLIVESVLPAGPGAAHGWNRIPGFFILFGSAGAILLVVGAKLVGMLIVEKDEDYYDSR